MSETLHGLLTVWPYALQPNGQATLDLGKLGVKLHFFYVKCNNNVAGLILPSEGYSRWYVFSKPLQIGSCYKPLVSTHTEMNMRSLRLRFWPPVAIFLFVVTFSYGQQCTVVQGFWLAFRPYFVHWYTEPAFSFAHGKGQSIAGGTT